jgi:hypothetical protein
MNVQIFNKPFAESFWLQTAVLVVLTAVLMGYGRRYQKPSTALWRK